MPSNSKSKTGPNTAGGKDKSSQNATTHGLRSEHFRLLKGESQEEFDKVHQGWIAQYGCQSAQPVSGVVRDLEDPGILLLIEKLAQDDWTVRRAMRALCNLQERLLEAESDNESEEAIQHIERRLALTVRYKTALENSFKRTLQQIEALFGRQKRNELKERVVFMRECVLAQQIVIDQRKAGIPAFLPWPANIYDRKKYNPDVPPSTN
jgi:hypothetical protein